MIKSDIYKMIFREYEKDRKISEEKYKQRLQEIYLTIPRVKEIDDELAKTSLTVTKAILAKSSDTKELVESLKQVNEKLISEKQRILDESNFPNDYLTNIYKCPICKDTGFVENSKCKCFAKKFISLFSDLSNIGNVFEYENFETFDPSYYSDTVDPELGKSPRERINSILETCLLFIRYFDSQFSNLFLYGKSGLGKTFLCNCIAKELLDKGKTVFYITAINLFKLIEYDRFERKDEEAHNQVLDVIFDVDLLIIDDLGTEFQTILSSSALFDIINARYLRKKPIIISTNLSPQNIINKYSERVVSRFYGNYDFLEFLGEDIRILKLTKGNNI